MALHKENSNRLLNETSPYLLQHAYNPVDWFPWGEEALELARKEDKVLLVSIGYSACHWCHVMERESFEDNDTAELMNAHFINVKIDREERPDIDHIFMEAVQAMTGNGGWPLNIFLTPDLKPFYGGTYFPPVPAHGRSSWKTILSSINTAWTTRRGELEAQAEKLIDHIKNAAPFTISKFEEGVSEEQLISEEGNNEMVANLLANWDHLHGGFGKAPKFLHTHSIKFLLQNFHYTKNKEALNAAESTLQHMLQSGIYDQVGGGISRYSTDIEWKVPHFEKMLYDNALLLSCLSDCFLLTKKEIYKYYIDKTIDFLRSEMLDASGLYYAALDADSEGIEGKYYLWSSEEIREILKDDAEQFSEWFQIEEDGNLPPEQDYWVGRNVLHTSKDHLGTVPSDNIQTCLKKLGHVRSQRIRPATDNKMILGWNALLINGFCRAYIATNNEEYKQYAESLGKAINAIFINDENGFHNIYASGSVKGIANLDDLSYLADAYLSLQEITGDTQYLLKANAVVDYTRAHFEDEDKGFFYFSSDLQNDIPIRKKEFYDSAMSSGNAVMASVLLRLAVYFDKNEYKEVAIQMCRELKPATLKYPGTFTTWAVLLQNLNFGLNELVISPLNNHKIMLNVLELYFPFLCIQLVENEDHTWPMLHGKKTGNRETIWLCKDYQCSEPVHSIDRFIELTENM